MGKGKAVPSENYDWLDPNLTPQGHLNLSVQNRPQSAPQLPYGTHLLHFDALIKVDLIVSWINCIRIRETTCSYGINSDSYCKTLITILMWLLILLLLHQYGSWNHLSSSSCHCPSHRLSQYYRTSQHAIFHPPGSFPAVSDSGSNRSHLLFM